MEKSTLEHHNDSFVHVDRCLLDRLQEPDLRSLKLQEFHRALFLVSIDVFLHALLLSRSQSSSAHTLSLLVGLKSLLEVSEPLPIVLHERLEDLANALDFNRHSLAHPDCSLHILLLVFCLAAVTSLFYALQIGLQLGVLSFELFSLLLHFRRHH